jgi:hypothetical protein
MSRAGDAAQWIGNQAVPWCRGGSVRRTCRLGWRVDDRAKAHPQGGTPCGESRLYNGYSISEDALAEAGYNALRQPPAVAVNVEEQAAVAQGLELLAEI